MNRRDFIRYTYVGEIVPRRKHAYYEWMRAKCIRASYASEATIEAMATDKEIDA